MSLSFAYTATHCNTLQRTATLHHTGRAGALFGCTLHSPYRVAVFCSVLQCGCNDLGSLLYCYGSWITTSGLCGVIGNVDTLPPTLMPPTLFGGELDNDKRTYGRLYTHT